MTDEERAQERRAKILLNRIIRPEQFEDAIAWGEEVGNLRMNVLMLGREAELLRLWQAFTDAGSAPTAATLIAGLGLDIRRLFIHMITTAFGLYFEGTVQRFLRPDGSRLEVPFWFLRRVVS